MKQLTKEQFLRVVYVLCGLTVLLAVLGFVVVATVGVAGFVLTSLSAACSGALIVLWWLGSRNDSAN